MVSVFGGRRIVRYVGARHRHFVPTAHFTRLQHGKLTAAKALFALRQLAGRAFGGGARRDPFASLEFPDYDRVNPVTVQYMRWRNSHPATLRLTSPMTAIGQYWSASAA